MLQAASYISSSAENLYKFLFINGTVLVILSMFYPLNEKQELEIKANDYDNQVQVLNKEIEFLKNDLLVFQKHSKETIKILDSISKNRTSSSNELIEDIKNQYNSSFDSLKSIKRKLDFKQIKIEGEKKKIKTLKNQSRVYSNYSIYFLIIGIIFFIVGLIGWSKATVVLDKIKKAELESFKNKKSSKK